MSGGRVRAFRVADAPREPAAHGSGAESTLSFFWQSSHTMLARHGHVANQRCADATRVTKFKVSALRR